MSGVSARSMSALTKMSFIASDSGTWRTLRPSKSARPRSASHTVPTSTCANVRGPMQPMSELTRCGTITSVPGFSLNRST